VSHKRFFLLFLPRRFYKTAGLQSDLVTQDLEIWRRVARGVVLVCHGADVVACLTCRRSRYKRLLA
jgi:hypothetical protein